MTSFWITLRRFPPFVVRLLARTLERKPRALTTEEIARASGLPVSYVVSLSSMKTWDDVPVAHLKAFSSACGIDFGNARNVSLHLHFCRKRGLGKWRYLRRSPDFDTLYKPLLLMGKQNIQL